MKSILNIYQLVQNNLYRFIRSHSVAWVSSLFALMLVLPISLVGSCKEGTSISGSDVGQVYAEHFAAQYDASNDIQAITEYEQELQEGSSDLQISKTMVRAHKRQVRNLLNNNDQTMVNLQKGEVYLLFSRPELARKDGAFTSWHFRNENCVVDVFFEKDVEADIDRVAHYEVRKRQVAQFAEEQGSQEEVEAHEYSNADRAHCLADLLDRNKEQSRMSKVIVSSRVQ